MGLGEGRLRHRDLSRPTHGVRQAGTDPQKTELLQVAEAASLVLPSGSAFSHLTAARTLGLPVPKRWAPAEPLDVMNVSAAPKIRRAGCEGHRGLESRRVVQRNGLRVVSPEDTWCDLASTGTLDLDELIVLGDAVVHHQRGIPPRQLDDAVSRGRGWRGRRLMEEALSQLRPRNNSPMETRARLFFLRGGSARAGAQRRHQRPGLGPMALRLGLRLARAEGRGRVRRRPSPHRSPAIAERRGPAREPPGRRMGFRPAVLRVGDGPSAKPGDPPPAAPVARALVKSHEST